MPLLQRLCSGRSWPIGTKLLVATVPAIVAVTVLAAWAVHERHTANLQEKLTQRARSLYTQIMADRHYYASVIVPRIEALGGSFSPDYHQVPGQFPLPATFVREVSDSTAAHKNGYQVNLLSPWAINPTKRPQDQFQRDAFDYLVKNPTGHFVRTDTVEGRAVMRMLLGDFASAQSCVDCHNTHPKSPKRDFKLNDLMGGLEIIIPIEPYVQESRRDLLFTLAGGTALSVLILGIVGLGTKRMVTRPLARLADTMQTLTGTEEGPFPDGDEVKHLTERFERMRAILARQQHELQDAKTRLEQRVAERTRALQTLEEQHRVTMASLPVAVVRLGRDDAIRFANRTFADLVHRPAAATIGQPLSAVLPIEGIEAWLRGARVGEGFPVAREVEWRTSTGESRMLRLAVSGIRRADDDDDDDDDDDLVLVIEDLTDRKQLEAQLRQAQKMEAVGRLAGGVAHDFNNVLQVINGYSELLLETLARDDPRRRNVEQIQQAGQRAAALTHQLLAFSRKQVLQPKVLDLNAVVTAIEPLLRRVLGEDLAIRTVLGDGLGRIQADPGQLDQVLLNLAVNARDAMPHGGTLTITTANVTRDRPQVSGAAQIPPGSYVVLTVSDTGCGMDLETQARIFEPFFTTKGPDKGTGLGLAVVYGVMKQSGGWVTVESAVGRGTTFTLHFPRVDAALSASQASPAPAPGRHGSETILLVEDEVRVRAFLREVLRQSGYTVLEAGDGQEALRISAEHHGPIQLLLTDVVMPGMTGWALADRLASVRPELKVLFMSGYADEALTQRGVSSQAAGWLQKPVTPNVLRGKVRELLDAPHARA